MLTNKKYLPPLNESVHLISICNRIRQIEEPDNSFELSTLPKQIAILSVDSLFDLV